MQPYLLRIGSVYIPTYWVVFLLAFLIATWFVYREACAWPLGHYALAPRDVAPWGVLTILGGLLGARIWYVLQHWWFFILNPWWAPLFWRGGLVWYGGVLGSVIATWAFARRRRLPVLRVLDQVIPFIVLGHGIGRMGCFLHGCCYGKPTTAWWGVAFPQQPEIERIPIQLVEATALFTLYFVLRVLQERSPVLSRPGRLFGIYLLLYAPMRFVLERFRGDQILLIWGGWTIPQVVSIPVVLIGLLLCVGRPRTPQHGAAA